VKPLPPKQSVKFELMTLRTFIVQCVRDRLDRGGTWYAWHKAQLVRASYRAEFYLSKKFRREVLVEAQHFLAPLADSSDCRRGKTVWRNLSYCPPTPYGDYHWLYTCEMVQEIIWLNPEFEIGYRFGIRPRDPYRDANPYTECSRSHSWDLGYILGLNRKKVKEWIANKQHSTDQKSARTTRPAPGTVEPSDLNA